ncbi:MAG: glycosyltransferase [Bacteroidia bacterium]|nr:glycosyltransferase [Bacteroidia bacterium]
MRVLHLINRLDAGGVLRHVIDLAEGLAQQDVTSWIATWVPDGHTLRARDDVLVLPLYSQDGRRKSPYGAVRTITALRRFLITERIDILHMHSRFATMLGAAAARDENIRRVYTVHNDFADLSFLPWYPDTVIAPSESIRSSFLRNARLYRKGNVRVVPYGVPLAEGQRPHAITDTEFVFVGRMEPQKLPGLPLDALTYFPDTVRCSIGYYGGGTLQDELRAKADLLSRPDATRFHGYVDNPWTEIGNPMALLFPSDALDALPYAILEAFAAAVPVIASDLPQLRELVRPGETGLLFTPGDAHSLADRMLYALEHPDTMRTMGAQARVFVREHFSMQAMLHGTLEVYERLLPSP